MRKFKTVFMRGGTSKGCMFHKEDLPEDRKEWDNIFLQCMGDPDPKQIDGLGGTVSSNNKIVIVWKSEEPGVDVEYLVGQVIVGKSQVDYKSNCGNMTAAVGPYAVSNYYMETKRAQREAMLNAKKVILEMADRFEKMTGRKYGFFEEYRMEDAEYAVVIIGSAAGTCKAAIEHIRHTTGKKVGLIKIRVFRPFPEEELAQALSKVKAAAIMDRSEMFAATSGPLGAEVRAAMYQAKLSAEVVNYFYGLGGRDITVEDFEQVYDNLEKMAQTHVVEGMYSYIGLRER